MQTGTRVPPSVVQTAKYFLKAGEVITRLAVLLSIVFAIFLAVHLVPPAIRGELKLQIIIENLLMITLNLFWAGIISIGLDKWYKSSKYKLIGFIDLLAGAFTLISAPIAGILFITGGLLLYVAAEMISIFNIEEKLV